MVIIMNFLPSQANYRKYRFAVKRKYCGPGPLVSPFANDDVNKACEDHDYGYEQVQKRSRKWWIPYAYNVEADRIFLNKLAELESQGRLDWTGTVAKKFFTMKQKYLPEYKDEGDQARQRMFYAETMQDPAYEVLGWKPRNGYILPSNDMRSVAKQQKSYVRRMKRKTASFPKSLYGRKMPKRYRRASKRYSNKRGRFNYRKRRNRAIAKVVRGVSLKQNEYVVSAQYTNYFPVANGLVADPKTPAAHRSVTFSYPTYGDSNRTISALSSTVGYDNSSMQKYRVIKHETVNRITNAGLHPVHLVVYKYYFPSFQLMVSGATGTQLTAAAELALYNTTMNHGNSVNSKSREVPLGFLWMHNLYKGTALSTTITDAQRSWFDGSTFKTGSAGAEEVLVAFSRPVEMTKFKFKELNDSMKIKKYAVVTLNPGQTYICKLVKKNKWISTDEVVGATSGQFKGATGFIFHAVGGLVHDATDSTDVGRGPLALDMEVKQFWKMGRSFGNNQDNQNITANRIVYADIAAPQRAGADFAEELIS